MLDGRHAFILGDDRAGDGDEGFAGRVRDEMEMEIAASRQGLSPEADCLSHPMY